MHLWPVVPDCLSFHHLKKITFLFFSLSSASLQNSVFVMLCIYLPVWSLSAVVSSCFCCLRTTTNRFSPLWQRTINRLLHSIHIFSLTRYERKRELYLCITTSDCIVDCVFQVDLFLDSSGTALNGVRLLLNDLTCVIDMTCMSTNKWCAKFGKVLFKWICCFANDTECPYVIIKHLFLCKYVVSHMICNMYRFNFTYLTLSDATQAGLCGISALCSAGHADKVNLKVIRTVLK